jgi:hypothetical protein
MKIPSPLFLFGEAEMLIKNHGFHSGRGRPRSDNNQRCVIPYLSKKYGVSTRWIAKLLKKAKSQKKPTELVKSVSYQSGLAAAFAGTKSIAPMKMPVKEEQAQVDIIISPKDALKKALSAFLKNAKGSNRTAIELSMALFDELR